MTRRALLLAALIALCAAAARPDWVALVIAAILAGPALAWRRP